MLFWNGIQDHGKVLRCEAGGNMASKVAGQIREIGGRIEEIAGVKGRDIVMDGGDKAAKLSDRRKIALWVKKAIDRLDACTTPQKCQQIRGACGHNCITHAGRMVHAVKARRRKHKSDEEFLPFSFCV
jgi:hypothetical protein